VWVHILYPIVTAFLCCTGLGRQLELTSNPGGAASRTVALNQAALSNRH